MNPTAPSERQKREFFRSPRCPNARHLRAPTAERFFGSCDCPDRRGWAKTLGQGGSSKLEGKGIEMRRYFWMAVAGGAWAAWAAVACGAQSTPAAATAPTASPAATPAHSPAAALVPCSVAPQPVPCGTTPAVSGKQSATEQFPFPDEASGSGTSLTPYATPAKLSGVSQTADAPGAASGTTPSAASGTTPGAASGAAPAGKKGLDGDFPFPGEEGKDAAVSGTRDASGGSDANSSNSSSSSSSSGDDAGRSSGAGGRGGSSSRGGADDRPHRRQSWNCCWIEFELFASKPPLVRVPLAQRPSPPHREMESRPSIPSSLPAQRQKPRLCARSRTGRCAEAAREAGQPSRNAADFAGVAYGVSEVPLPLASSGNGNCSVALCFREPPGVVPHGTGCGATEQGTRAAAGE